MLSAQRSEAMAYQSSVVEKKCSCRCQKIAHQKDGSCLYRKRCRCPGYNRWRMPFTLCIAAVGCVVAGMTLTKLVIHFFFQ